MNFRLITSIINVSVNSPHLDHVLSQMNPVHIGKGFVYKIRFNIALLYNITGNSKLKSESTESLIEVYILSKIFAKFCEKYKDKRSVTIRWFNLLKTERICVIHGLCTCRAVNTLHLGYKNQSFNVA
jgi:hypothetical protein